MFHLSPPMFAYVFVQATVLNPNHYTKKMYAYDSKRRNIFARDQPYDFLFVWKPEICC